jgi:hypothetical protein
VLHYRRTRRNAAKNKKAPFTAGMLKKTMKSKVAKPAFALLHNINRRLRQLKTPSAASGVLPVFS